MQGPLIRYTFHQCDYQINKMKDKNHDTMLNTKSNTMLSNSDEWLSLFLILEEKIFSFFPLSMMLAMGLSYPTLYSMEKRLFSFRAME